MGSQKHAREWEELVRVKKEERLARGAGVGTDSKILAVNSSVVAV
jgi:hypothetical protein